MPAQVSNTNDHFTFTTVDNPGSSLTTVCFSGSCFLGWGPKIKMALGVKQKLGFIDGSFTKPDSTDPDY